MKTLQEYKNGYIGYKRDKPYKAIANLTQRLNGMVQCMPDSIEKIKDFRAAVNKIEEESSAISMECSVEDLASLITDEIESAKVVESDRCVEELNSLIEQIDERKENIIRENKEHNKRLKEGDVEANAGWGAVEEKKQSLMPYSDTVFDLCHMYGISTTEVYVPESVKTIETLTSLYDGYAKYLSKEERKRNPIVWFREKVPDVRNQGVVLLIILILSFTPLLVLGTVAMFIYLITNQIQNRSRVNYYSLLAALLFNCDLSEMKISTYSDSDLLPEEIRDEELNTDERFKDLVQKIEAKQTELDKLEDTEDSNIDMSVYNEYLSSIESLREDFRYEEEIVRDEKENIAIRIRELNKILDESEKYFISQWKELGQDYNMSSVYKTTYKLGLNNYEYEEVDYGLSNIIIRPSGDEEATIRFVRTMYVNAFCNVLPELLSVTVYDPNSLGQPLMALYADDPFKLLVDFQRDGLEDILKDLRAYTDEGMKLMQGRSIQEFNAECDETGKIPRGYRLLIILSQSSKMEESEELQSFLSYSAKYGVFIWVVSNTLNAPDTKVVRRIWRDVENPIIDWATDEKCRNFKYEFEKAKKAKGRRGMNFEKFLMQITNDGKYWTQSASERIQIIVGYKGGDPAEPTVFSVGNTGDIHALCVGGTGAGKSVLLNEIINTCCLRYSPKELELWLVDFKGNEFSYYLGTPEYPQMLPHIKACLCTSDGDYAASLFEHFDKLSAKRYQYLMDPQLLYPGENIPGFKNMMQWNGYWDLMAKEAPDEETARKYLDRKWTRIFMICDEFQVIFSKGSDDVKAAVTRAITSISKVARACGCHLLFGSQSMNKTVSADVLNQFSLRFALRLDDVSTSNEILGTPVAAQIREQNGYLYIRNTETKGGDLTKYSTPYIPDKDEPGKPSRLRQLVITAHDLAIEQNMPKHDVISYQEVTEHPIEELAGYYEDKFYEERFPDHGMLILGERMAYEENKLPDNVQLENINNKHIYSDFSVYNDLVLFFNTIMENISHWRVKPQIIINSQISDLLYITEAENYVTEERFKQVLDEKTSCETIVTWLAGILEKRQETKKKDPLYIILMGWDKGQGIGINPDPVLKKKFEAFLQMSAEFGMHVIIINTRTVFQFSSILEACAVRIAGKCTNEESSAIIGNKRAGANYEGKMANGGYMFVWCDGRVTRDKLYISEIKHEVKSSKLVIN